jgi:hypothetical protein
MTDNPSSPHVRLLNEADAPAAFDVHRRALESLADKTFMYCRDLDYFTAIAHDEGRLIGAYIQDELVGYIAIRLPGSASNTHWMSLQHLPIDPRSITEGAGSAVLPEHRSKGLFGKLLTARNAIALGLGAEFQTSVVAPRNLSCLLPVLADDSLMAATYEDHTGLNYLLVKPLARRLEAAGFSGTAVGLEDIPGNLFHLSTGEIGVLSGHKQVAYHMSKVDLLSADISA